MRKHKHAARRPAVILGDFSGRRVPQLQAMGWGRMKIDRALRNRRGELTVAAGEPWAIDNGAFRMWTNGLPFEWSIFERQLTAAAALEAAYLPRFAVLPDLPARGIESLEYSLTWLHGWMDRQDPTPAELRAIDLAPGSVDRLLELPWFLAVQDGMTPADLERPCPCCGERIVDHDGILGIFLGGSSQWKVDNASAWAEVAKRYRMDFHYARAGTIAKLEQAHELGADSVDSAFPMWTSERWSKFEQAWRSLGTSLQRELALGGAA